MKSMNVKHNDTFNTPISFFNQLDAIFRFSYDGACDSSNIKCLKGSQHDLGVDGLNESWSGERVFLNPPFSNKKKWIEKAIYEVEKNNCPVCVMVLPLNCMSTIFFQDMIIDRYRYEIPKGRISFLNNETKKTEKGNNSGSVIIYFTKKLETNKS